MTPVEQVLQFFGKVALYGGGSVTLAFAVFRFLGKSWIERPRPQLRLVVSKMPMQP